jgi:hypothetical protein
MSVRMGRFGPFVQIGTKDDEDKPRFAGLRPGQKMDAITHAEAMELFKLPRKFGRPPTGEEITTNVGRFGPYVKYGAKYVSLKIDDPYDDHARARARGHPRKGNRGCQPPDPGFSRRRHPGAERPLRPVHHRQEKAQRQDSQGQGAEEPDLGGMPGPVGGGAGRVEVRLHLKYRHSFHAGNFADVHKHVTLLALLTALQRKDKGFLFRDPRGSRGLRSFAGRHGGGRWCFPLFRHRQQLRGVAAVRDTPRGVSRAGG